MKVTPKLVPLGGVWYTTTTVTDLPFASGPSAQTSGPVDLHLLAGVIDNGCSERESVRNRNRMGSLPVFEIVTLKAAGDPGLTVSGIGVAEIVHGGVAAATPPAPRSVRRKAAESAALASRNVDGRVTRAFLQSFCSL